MEQLLLFFSPCFTPSTNEVSIRSAFIDVLLPHALVPVSRNIELGIGKIIMALQFFSINGTSMSFLLLYLH